MEATRPLTVLVAEDEPAMLSLVARHLRGLGVSVVEASEGDAAWELAREHHPDLVLLDVMMPGMSGWEVCKRLKGPSADGAFSRTGVIMLTGIGENLNEMTSPLFAADAWLNKPFDFTELDVRIRDTLGRYGKHLPDVEPDPHAAELDAELAEEEREPAPIRVRAAAKKAAPKKKAAAKKAPAKKAAPKKAAAKKAPAKKAAAKKAAAKKAAAKKAAPKKAAPKKPAAKKKAPAKKAAPKKPAR